MGSSGGGTLPASHRVKGQTQKSSWPGPSGRATESDSWIKPFLNSTQLNPASLRKDGGKLQRVQLVLLGPWEGRRCLLGREELGGVTWLGRGSLMTSPVSARPGNHRTLVGRPAGALQPGMDVHLAAARRGVGGEGGGGGLGRG